MKYLFATDGSKTSQKAFAVLLKLVTKEDEVILLNVSDGQGSSGAQGRAALSDCETDLRLEMVSSVSLQREGPARTVICETASKEEVDIVVMGSHGMGLLSKKYTKLGSVAHYVATHTKAATLIVKP